MSPVFATTYPSNTAVLFLLSAVSVLDVITIVFFSGVVFDDAVYAEEHVMKKINTALIIKNGRNIIQYPYLLLCYLRGQSCSINNIIVPFNLNGIIG